MFGQFVVVILSLSFLLSGCGTVKVYKRAKWENAAEQGDLEGMYQLGLAYCCGAAPIYDNRIATQWLCKAARAGHIEAMHDLGQLYRKDKSFINPFNRIHAAAILSDNAVSYTWFTLASKQGHDEAKQALYEMDEVMTPSDRNRVSWYLQGINPLPCEL